MVKMTNTYGKNENKNYLTYAKVMFKIDRTL